MRAHHCGGGRRIEPPVAAARTPVSWTHATAVRESRGHATWHRNKTHWRVAWRVRSGGAVPVVVGGACISWCHVCATSHDVTCCDAADARHKQIKLLGGASQPIHTRTARLVSSVGCLSCIPLCLLHCCCTPALNLGPPSAAGGPFRSSSSHKGANIDRCHRYRGGRLWSREARLRSWVLRLAARGVRLAAAATAR